MIFNYNKDFILILKILLKKLCAKAKQKSFLNGLELALLAFKVWLLGE